MTKQPYQPTSGGLSTYVSACGCTRYSLDGTIASPCSNHCADWRGEKITAPRLDTFDESPPSAGGSVMHTKAALRFMQAHPLRLLKRPKRPNEVELDHETLWMHYDGHTVFMRSNDTSNPKGWFKSGSNFADDCIEEREADGEWYSYLDTGEYAIKPPEGWKP